MLWDIVFEFYVKYIFGGFLSNSVSYGGILGIVFNQSDSAATLRDTSNVYAFTIKSALSGSEYNMPLGNYLSLIATIISMVVILVICCALIKKIYNMCAHIIG